VPAGNFFWIVFFVLSFFFRHHHGSKILVMAIIKLLAFAWAPLTDGLGFYILTYPSLQDTFTAWYNMPFVPFTNFNHTLVAGGIVAGIVLFIPAYFIVLALVPVYRRTIAQKIRETKLFKNITKAPLISALIKAVQTAQNAAGVLN